MGVFQTLLAGNIGQFAMVGPPPIGCSGAESVSCGAVSSGGEVSSIDGAGSSVGGVSARHAKRKIEAAGIIVLIFIYKPFLILNTDNGFFEAVDIKLVWRTYIF